MNKLPPRRGSHQAGTCKRWTLPLVLPIGVIHTAYSAETPSAQIKVDQVGYLPAGAKGLPPAKVYLDEQDSYASNEIAIHWQAALVFLLAGSLPVN